METKRLIDKPGTIGYSDLKDKWWLIAYEIESSMLNAGAKPGEDYTILDLYKLARPFILGEYQSENLTWTHHPD